MVSLYLMGEKGLTVLKECLQYKKSIVQVIGARDKNVQNDYYDEIRKVCSENGIEFHDRMENVSVQSEYSIAISWRWMINHEADSRLIIIHDSLLPKYRGFAPLVNMLINHEPKVGVTAIFANGEFDRGDIITQKSIDVQYPIRIQDAIEQVSKLYGDLVLDLFGMINNSSEIPAEPQNESEATYSLWRNEDDYEIDWSKDSEFIQQFIYSVGFPFRGASSSSDGIKYRFFDCETVEDVIIENRCPGKVMFIQEGYPVIVCGKGLLKITQLKTDDGQSCIPLKKFRMWFK